MYVEASENRPSVKKTISIVVGADIVETVVKIHIYSGSVNEDVEAFFETWNDFVDFATQLELFNNGFAQNAEARQLFVHFRSLLTGSAREDWDATISEHFTPTNAQPIPHTWRHSSKNLLHSISFTRCYATSMPT